MQAAKNNEKKEKKTLVPIRAPGTQPGTKGGYKLGLLWVSRAVPRQPLPMEPPIVISASSQQVMITGIVAITDMKLPSSVKPSRRGGRRARSSIPNLPRGGWVLDKPPNHFSWGVYKNYFCISDIPGRRGAGREGRGCLLVLAGRLCAAVGQLMGGGHSRLAPRRCIAAKDVGLEENDAHGW